MNENLIQQLFADTQAAFAKAPIKKYADANGHLWNYSISSTRITEGANLIIGFNWGVSGNEPYKPQNEIPKENFKELYDKNDLGSLQRIYLPLKQRFPAEDIDNAMQTNFCFFRSKTEGEITSEDLMLSTPLFQQLINIIKPKRILAFSKKLQSYCIESALCSDLEEASFPSNKRTLHTAKGNLKLNDTVVPIYFLPHPNAKFTSIARKKAWDFCFGNK
ncbi:MAG TPA: hypothetical protein PK185_10820 [Cyclobacteriaceae bacterium]|nr:hypothetical protein [Cyclobacteriaceae bacterium]